MARGEFAGLRAFGLLDLMCKPDLLFAGAYEVLARAIHEEYVRLRVERGESRDSDPSMAPWEKLPENLKESNRSQASQIGLKLAAVRCSLSPLTDWRAEGFTFEEEEAIQLAKKEHARWIEERKGAGWTEGDKNLRRETSPHLVPWEELDPDTREIDLNFIRALPRVLAKAGFQIVREEGAPGPGPIAGD